MRRQIGVYTVIEHLRRVNKLDEIELTIDDKKVKAKAGQTILQVAKEFGFDIPTLCYYEKVKPQGACRVCVVEVENRPTLVASCCTPAEKDMVIHTSNERVLRSRRMTVELLLANHKNDCLTCESNGKCELQDLAYKLGIERDKMRFEATSPNKPLDDSNPFIIRDPNKCILCGRCVQVCEEVQFKGVIGFAKRGYEAYVTAGADVPLSESMCAYCGECIQACPVGALTEKLSKFKGRNWELNKTTTTCPYCGCGCEIEVYSKDNNVVKVMGSEKGAVNKGSLCVKGRFGFDFINSKDRLKRPLIRQKKDVRSQKTKVRRDQTQEHQNTRAPDRNNSTAAPLFREASWDEALDLIASKLKEIKSKFGPDSIAGLSSAKCTNEENYLMQKFMRAAIGTNNIDHCARLCHASTVAGLASAFGSGAMTNSISEIAQADVILLTGSNTTENHPIIALEIKKAVKDGAKLIIVDPRSIELCEVAHLHLQQRPGTDVAWMNGMMNVIISEGLWDEEFVKERCENFEEFRKVIEKYTPDYVEKITGISQKDLKEAARVYAKAQRATIIYSMGITQHTTGTDNVLSTANLAMLTGNVGKESTGVNPLRGQNNVQGACDLGALPNVFPGYKKVTDESIRKTFEEAWKASLPSKDGLTVVEMINAAGEGKLKALYIMGENPMVSDPDLKHVEEGLKNLELLVVQDIFLTETAQLADVVLPAVSFAERDGTFTNTERRVQRVRKAIEPISSEALPDWKIISLLSSKVGYKMDYPSPSEIMDEMAALTPIYGGINYKRLNGPGLSWPCPDTSHPGTKFLHKDNFTRGKGKFHAVKFIEPAELPDEEFPLILTTGRMLYHWHTGSMSRRSKGLDEICPEGYVEISASDANRLGISADEMVKVTSRRGEIKIKANLNNRVPKGVVFIPFHFAESAANVLTNPALDPVAKIPEFKVCAVKISKVYNRIRGGGKRWPR